MRGRPIEPRSFRRPEAWPDAGGLWEERGDEGLSFCA